MNAIILSRTLILGSLISLGSNAHAQSALLPTTDHHTEIDAAITYTAERAKIASVDCGCFWLQGGSADLAFTVYHGLGVALNLTGVHNADIQAGLALDTVMFSMGPRYTFRLEKPRVRFAGKEGIALFGQGLIGGKHGFNGVFPSSGGVKGADSSFAIQVGGGLDIGVTKTIAIRAIEAELVRSTLVNNASGVQNDLRLAAGISFHIAR